MSRPSYTTVVVPDLQASLQELLGERYQLVTELGRGGMATVYRARDLRHDREVAIKVMTPDLATLLGRERFVREIAIASSLAHPNIVPLYDSGGEGDVLYYVMPLIAGESLRDKLDRETQLAQDEALAITRDVAEGLGYAHARGVVHRDVKPENILLAGGKAMLTDFGIAKAIAELDAERLTSKGIVPGTPPYMSPEQASGSYMIDGRADLYALGCVLHEMLAGSPPFTGRTVQVILNQHLSVPPPPIRTLRPTVAPGVERVLLQLLAKVPADRFPTSSRFVTAMDSAVLTGSWEVQRPGWRTRAKVGAAAAALVALAWLVIDQLPIRGGGAVEPDTSRYVLLPMEASNELSGSNALEQLLRDALTRWQGIDVADPFQVHDALAQLGDRRLSTREARRVASQLGAGRFIRSEVSVVGESLRVRAAVFDAAGGGQLAERVERVPADLSGADSAMAILADHLLLREGGDIPRRDLGTRSLPARQALVRGQAAIQAWDLGAADSAFTAAVAFDNGYAAASLWLALSRWWADRPTPTWQSASEHAVAGIGSLSARDRLLASGVNALSRGNVELACGTFGRLASSSRFDFAAWYAWATCLRRDNVVLRDLHSPSGWRFRSSYHQALLAYRHALLLLPSMHRSLRDDGFQPIRRTLRTSGRLRFGRAAEPDTITFGASSAWSGDTLLMVPYPLADFAAAQPWTVPATGNEAIRHAREAFREIAAAFVAAYPNSPDALEAMALSLELLGDPACLDTLRRARTLVTGAEDGARLAAMEVWTLLKFSIPERLDGVRRARELADSLLRVFKRDSAGDPAVMAGLATLRGRSGEAAALSRQPAAVAKWLVPAPLTEFAPALLAYAALGGPAESLVTLEERASAAISQTPRAQQAQFRSSWLVRPATLALPSHEFRVLRELEGSSDYLANAEAAFVRGDRAAARDTLFRVRFARRNAQPSDMAMDAAYPEAWLLASIGEHDSAVAGLDRTLAALPQTAPGFFDDPARAGSLVHAMALRASLASRAGDSLSVRKWGAVVATLWTGADAFLSPIVQRMNRYAQ